MKNIIGVACMLGQKKKGVNLSPLFFNTQKNIMINNFENYQNLYNLIKKNNNNKLITIGGDHSIAVSTISAINDNYVKENKKMSVIWVDAHSDINTPETSNSGNIHGMPVAFLLGLSKFKYVNFENYLTPKQIHYIGLRDVELEEFNILKKLNINYYTSQDVKTYGITNIIKQIKEKTENDNIHISFDVDALDPVIMPNTGTSVSNGLNLNDAIQIIKHFDAKTMDIVEFNPFISISKTDLEMSLFVVNNMISNFFIKK